MPPKRPKQSQLADEYENAATGRNDDGKVDDEEYADDHGRSTQGSVEEEDEEVEEDLDDVHTEGSSVQEPVE